MITISSVINLVKHPDRVCGFEGIIRGGLAPGR
jgi:hypothetical protein